MIHLNGTTETLEIETSAVGSIDFSASFADVTSSSVNGGSNQGNITAAATTIVVAAPAAFTTRQIKTLFVTNKGTGNNSVRIKKDVGGTEYHLSSLIVLQAGECLRLDADGLTVHDITGRAKKEQTENYTGQSFAIYKIGTAPEAAGTFYSWSKDSGLPGAWNPGTPGLNGRNTDGTTAADAGSINFANPATGSIYLADADFAATAACLMQLYDILWVNTGLVVTTTTAQAITQPTLPARDINGSVNGEGIGAGLLVTTATTNAAAITNCTISYTNSDGVAGRTGTMASFPQTANIGTFVPFQLQAGDKGVRSIQSITLGTSLAAGAVSLACYRQIFSQPITIANVGGTAFPKQLNIRLYNGSCILPFALASGTGAMTLTGNVYLVNK